MNLASWILMLAFLGLNPFGFATWIINLCYVAIVVDVSSAVAVIIYKWSEK
jgi:hypothetical protein